MHILRLFPSFNYSQITQPQMLRFSYFCMIYALVKQLSYDKRVGIILHDIFAFRLSNLFSRHDFCPIDSIQAKRLPRRTTKQYIAWWTTCLGLDGRRPIFLNEQDIRLRKIRKESLAGFCTKNIFKGEFFQKLF